MLMLLLLCACTPPVAQPVPLTSCIKPAVGQVGDAAYKPTNDIQHQQLHTHSSSSGARRNIRREPLLA